MKILFVNKFHYLKGGSEKYYFELAQLMKENGHEVAFFSMKDEKNIKTDCKEYFVEPIDLNNGSKLKALEVIYSKKNRKKMEEALEEFKPDIVHLNNFQRQLSASIIEPIKKRNIPIVFTAHDVQAICPASTMLDQNKNICEECMGGKYINCIRKKCNKGSTLKSVIGATEGLYYRKSKIYLDKIDYIITPSEFYKKQFIKDGISENKICAMHNFIDLKEDDLENKDEGYALYFGRISKEKGILNLIEAFSKLDKGTLLIAGTGEEKQNVEDFIKENDLENRVKLLGFLGQEQMKEMIRKCKFVVVPSIWYENCPYSILETMEMGKPLIGSRIGGIPELIKENENGFLYKYDDVEELSKCMKKIFDDEQVAITQGKKSRELLEKNYTEEMYYNKIIEIYNTLIKGKQNV